MISRSARCPGVNGSTGPRSSASASAPTSSATTRSGPGTTSIPIQGDWRGPIFEGYLILAGWAAVTSQRDARADGRRQHVPEPGADGEDGDDARPHEQRAGDPRHRRRLVRARARGLRDRVRVGLRRAARPGSTRRSSSCATMLRDGPATARGPRYHAASVRNDPPPIQTRLPILIGGDGEKKTLATVARYADVVEHRRRHRVRPAQGRGPPALVRDGSDATSPRSSGRSAWAW